MDTEDNLLLFSVDEDRMNALLEVTSNLIPEKSKEKYYRIYFVFSNWRRSKGLDGKVDEDILLRYFREKAETMKISSLWPMYSMLKSTLQIHENVDISVYKKLYAYLKQQNDNYAHEPKRTKTLTMENVTTFLNKAADSTYLLMKTVLLFGLSGSCRREELCSLKCKDIVDTGNILVVTLHDKTTKKKRIFTVTSEFDALSYYRKYASLRPRNVSHDRFFLFYKDGKCYIQPVGINTFGMIPKKIAEYLKLPEPNLYTGHCLRRTSATIFSDSRAATQNLKRYRTYHSATIVEGCIEDSVSNVSNVVKTKNGSEPSSSASFHQQIVVKDKTLDNTFTKTNTGTPNEVETFHPSSPLHHHITIKSEVMENPISITDTLPPIIENTSQNTSPLHQNIVIKSEDNSFTITDVQSTTEETSSSINQHIIFNDGRESQFSITEVLSPDEDASKTLSTTNQDTVFNSNDPENKFPVNETGRTINIHTNAVTFSNMNLTNCVFNIYIDKIK